MSESDYKNLEDNIDLITTDPELTVVIRSIAAAVKVIAENLRCMPCHSLGRHNESGDEQNSLDTMADAAISSRLIASERVFSFISEEAVGVTKVHGLTTGLDVAFDPLDGSKEIEHNGPCGSIFSIFEQGSFDSDDLRGSAQKAALLAIYGPRTEIFVTTNDTNARVFRCVLNADRKFEIVNDDVRLKEDGRCISPANFRAAGERVDYLHFLGEQMQSDCDMRFHGSCAADMGSILSRGQGLFISPSSSKKPLGTMRMLYENAPLALVSENAGGKAVDEKGVRILDLPIKQVHQRGSIIMGSKNMVNQAVAHLTSPHSAL